MKNAQMKMIIDLDLFTLSGNKCKEPRGFVLQSIGSISAKCKFPLKSLQARQSIGKSIFIAFTLRLLLYEETLCAKSTETSYILLQYKKNIYNTIYKKE